ncbi:hypothetical protein L6452_30770 [Arctium lappa]|uniref:Uncharacterized protein n=1 Tax=Arctium lappa TaxID=4217 RepID=A0ACB8ZK26_ARCLA|nr:hypothetical protein L6452_30770 [Arctium lappa]
MDNRHLLFTTSLIFLLTLIFFDCSVALGDKALVGGWKPITNVTDPTVVDNGKFAVDEHNKKYEESLKFKKMVSGESQVVAGINYNLTITAVDGSVENNYVAVVYVRPWEKFRMLVSFKGPI